MTYILKNPIKFFNDEDAEAINERKKETGIVYESVEALVRDFTLGSRSMQCSADEVFEALVQLCAELSVMFPNNDPMDVFMDAVDDVKLHLRAMNIAAEYIKEMKKNEEGTNE